MFRLRFGKKNYVVICYAVVWQHVIGVVCVLFAVWSVTVWCVYCSLCGV